MAERLTRKDPGLEEYKQWFMDAEDATLDSRTKAERDRDYYDNKQLTSSEISTLNKRGQPPIVINRIKPKIDFLRGAETQTRTDPKAYPRTQVHEQDADAATQAIRFVCDNNDFDRKRSAVWDNMLVEGAGAAIVTVSRPRESGEIEIDINEIPWDRLFYDPHSSKPDFSDARYMGIVICKNADEALDLWPDKDDVLESTLDSASSTDTYDDKPKHGLWSDGRHTRVRCIEMYYRFKKTWWRVVFTGGGILEEARHSPYHDEFGFPENPIKATSAYIDRDNNRYGVVRVMIDPQDEINKRRSKSLHLLSTNQIVYEEGAFDDVNEASREIAKPDGKIKKNRGFEVEFVKNMDLASGQVQLLNEAKSEIDQVGPSAALTGSDDRIQSGKALLAKQQAGFIGIGPLMDRKRAWDRQIYRTVWNRIRQFWDQERWIRVTDDPQNIRFVGLNVTRRTMLANDLQAQNVPPEQIRLMIGRTVGNPEFDQPVDTVVAQMDVDISIEDGIDTPTLQAEQFELMMKMAGSGIQLPPDVIIEMSQLPPKVKQTVLQRLRGDTPEGQQQAQANQAQQKMAMEREDAETQKIHSETAENMADADNTRTDTFQKQLEIAGGTNAS